MRSRRVVSLAAAVALISGAAVATQEVVHVEQPTAIALDEYTRTWPCLGSVVARVSAGDPSTAKSVLLQVPAGCLEGALNYLAQLERQHGRLSEAEQHVHRAVALAPRQHLHYFQLAMIYHARLGAASGAFERWSWHRKTKEAYQKAFQLDSRPVAYRYYLAYSDLQEPRLMGGSSEKALKMAEDGINVGQREFYVVRADVHRFRSEIEEAFADYDRALQGRVFKLNSFVAATRLALQKRDLGRARRYAEWSVTCRPDSAKAHEVLGDYDAAAGDLEAARQSYRTALTWEPGCTSCVEKLAALNSRAK